MFAIGFVYSSRAFMATCVVMNVGPAEDEHEYDSGRHARVLAYFLSSS